MERRGGFTLLEVIASLVLLGIAGVLGGLFIIRAMEGYVLASANTTTSQKSQAALGRLSLELENITGITSAPESGSSIVYSMIPYPGSPEVTRAIALVGDRIKIIDGSTLPTVTTGYTIVDHVSSLQFDYYDISSDFTGLTEWLDTNSTLDLYAIKITTVINRTDPEGGTFNLVTIVNPRRNGRYNGPKEWNR